MAENRKVKKAVDLPEKKDATNAALPMDGKESVAGKESTEHVPKKKQTVVRKMKAVLKKVLQGKLRKKRSLPPIVAATLKFHKDDDDVDPAAEESVGTK